MRRVRYGCGLLLLSCLLQAAEPRRPHILFIAIDDLRPDVGPYALSGLQQANGPDQMPQVRTPHMDRLAAEGLVFERAYCQQAVCGPSRLSLMTGTYPDRFRIYGMGTRMEWRERLPELTSLPQHFRAHGWRAIGFGKIYDDRLGLDRDHSWDAFTPGWQPRYALPEHRAVEQEWQQAWARGGKPSVRMPAVEAAEVPDNRYTDGHITDLAVAAVEGHDPATPLFLAVGYPKPHLPFVAPKRYWNAIDRASIPLPSVTTGPEGHSPYTFSDYDELRDTYDVPELIDADTHRELIHGYWACVGYVDAQIGRLLAALEARGMLDDTLVVLWGDHGFKLGEYGHWAKFTNLEVDARVPLILRMPKEFEGPRGAHTDALVELVDLFPTLAGAAGLSVPDSVQGISFLPTLRDPESPARGAALSQYPRGPLMGYSLRTDRWRFVEWRDRRGRAEAVELYDLAAAPMERINVAADHPGVVAELRARLNSYPLDRIPETAP